MSNQIILTEEGKIKIEAELKELKEVRRPDIIGKIEQAKEMGDLSENAEYHDAKDLAIGVSTEAAELLEHFRFKTPEQIKAFFLDTKKREDIEDEMADVLFFLLCMAQRYDVDIAKALARKLEKNNKKYPVLKVKGQNKKYSEY